MAGPATFRGMLEPMAGKPGEARAIGEALPELPRCGEGPTSP
jgi:hypothetical protein